MDEDQSARRVAQKYLKVVDADYYEFESKNSSSKFLYLVQLIEQPITNSEYLQRIFCLFTFSVVSTGKGFKLHHNSTKICQYNSLH